MMNIDPGTRTQVAVAGATIYTGGAAGAVFGTTTFAGVVATGAAAGAAGGATGAALNDRNVVLGALAGGASGAVFAGVGDRLTALGGGANYCMLICGGAAAGAVNAAITGGDIGRGALLGAISGAAVTAVYAAGIVADSFAHPGVGLDLRRMASAACSDQGGYDCSNLGVSSVHNSSGGSDVSVSMGPNGGPLPPLTAKLDVYYTPNPDGFGSFLSSLQPPAGAPIHSFEIMRGQTHTFTIPYGEGWLGFYRALSTDSSMDVIKNTWFYRHFLR